MNTKQAVAQRIKELCDGHGMTINALGHASGIPPSTIYSMLNQKSKNPGIVTLKKLCDGFDDPPVTLADFFDTDVFRGLEQEIK